MDPLSYDFSIFNLIFLVAGIYCLILGIRGLVFKKTKAGFGAVVFYVRGKWANIYGVLYLIVGSVAILKGLNILAIK